MQRLEQSKEFASEKNIFSLNLLDVSRTIGSAEGQSKPAELTSIERQEAALLTSSLERNELNASIEILRKLAIDPEQALKVLNRTRAIYNSETYSLQLLTEKNSKGEDQLKNIDVVSKFNNHHHRIEAGTGKYSQWFDIGDGQLLSKASLEKAKTIAGLLDSGKLNSTIAEIQDLASDPGLARAMLGWAKGQTSGKGLDLNLLTHIDNEGKVQLRQVDIVSPYNKDHHRIEMESGRYIRLRKIGDQSGNNFLAPEAASAFQSAESEARKNGIELEINSSWRSYREQSRLYKNLNGISPVAYPGTSMHEAGLAVDVENYEEARPYLEKNGWYWPNFPRDPWHFEYWK